MLLIHIIYSIQNFETYVPSTDIYLILIHIKQRSDKNDFTS